MCSYELTADEMATANSSVILCLPVLASYEVLPEFTPLWICGKSEEAQAISPSSTIAATHSTNSGHILTNGKIRDLTKSSAAVAAAKDRLLLARQPVQSAMFAPGCYFQPSGNYHVRGHTHCGNGL